MLIAANCLAHFELSNQFEAFDKMGQFGPISRIRARDESKKELKRNQNGINEVNRIDIRL
jgi:hypothetical protein